MYTVLKYNQVLLLSIGSLTEEGLSKLAEKMGEDWKHIAFLLDFTTTDVNRIDESNPMQKDKSETMLNNWMGRESGYNISKLGRLAEVFKRVKRKDLAEQLTL